MEYTFKRGDVVKGRRGTYLVIRDQRQAGSYIAAWNLKQRYHHIFESGGYFPEFVKIGRAKMAKVDRKLDGAIDYTFYVYKAQGFDPIIFAGCRTWYSFEEAIAHYRKLYDEVQSGDLFPLWVGACEEKLQKVKVSLKVLTKLGALCRKKGIRGLGPCKPFKMAS
jgi:hypothetical protein